MKRTKPRLLVIGIDGADHLITRRLLGEGRLPNLNALAGRGASGAMQSTVPPNSPPAWTTLMTGKNPGKHGVFDFLPMASGTPDTPIAARRRATTLWRALSDGGLRVGTYNLPATYPPEALSAFQVSGFDAPGFRPQMADPERAFALLKEVVGEYDLCPLSIQAPHGDPEAVERHADLPVVATRALLNAFPCDVYMVSFQVVDWVHHGALGREMKPGDVGSLASDGSVVRTYQLVDERVGELLAEWAADDTTVIVISDHGGTSADRLVNLEKVFLDHGLMAYLPLAADGSPVGEQRARAQRALRLWTSLKRLAPWVARVLGPLARRLRGRMAEYQNRLAIDWSHTRAAPWGEFAQVRLNLAGRDPRGIVAEADAEALADEVTGLLSSLRDPESGCPIYKSVLRNAELYHGPFASAGPDLYAVPHDLRYLSVSARLGAGDLPMLDLQPDPIVCLDPPWGRHSPVGILFMAGPTIQPGVGIAEATLADFAPTALYLLGEAVPDDMDGRVVSEAFRPEVLSRRPMHIRQPWPEPVPPDEAQSYSAEEQAEIERRLRALGYL